MRAIHLAGEPVSKEASMFRNASLVVLLFAFTMLPGIASGEPTSVGLKRMAAISRAADAIVVPVEWGGVWATEDSTYDCAGVLQSVTANVDTLCPGEPAYAPQQSPVAFDCTGTANATSVDVTCTGSSEFFPNCTATFTSTLRGTLTGDSYFLVSTTVLTFAGTAPECAFVPGYCTQVNSHGTRTGPAPIDYCQTAARPTTWGSLKLRYR